LQDQVRHQTLPLPPYLLLVPPAAQHFASMFEKKLFVLNFIIDDRPLATTCHLLLTK
jgi:hypothetical protein